MTKQNIDIDLLFEKDQCNRDVEKSEEVLLLEELLRSMGINDEAS